jgi:hypothetical protein
MIVLLSFAHGFSASPIGYPPAAFQFLKSFGQAFDQRGAIIFR